jgi:hypothetical protein
MRLKDRYHHRRTLESLLNSRVCFVDNVDIPCRKTYPNTYHWYLFVKLFTPDAQKSWSCKTDCKDKAHKHDDKKAASKDSKKEEEFDLFGDDKKDEKKEDKPIPAATTPAPVKPKKVVIAKSILVFDVKIYEAETDLNKLAERVYEIKMDGYS